MVYALEKDAMKMYPARFSKILFILWMTRCHAAITQQVDCGKEDEKYNLACEGSNMTLACPKEKPLLEIANAMFGRTMSERRICLRPGNINPDRSKSVKCEKDVTMKVAELCADEFPCVFNVNNLTFYDPCPGVYKYMWVRINCHCRQRYTRAKETTSCIPRKSNSTTSKYTIIHPSPTLITTGQSISQNITISSGQSIKITAKPTKVVSTQSARTAVLTSITVTPKKLVSTQSARMTTILTSTATMSVNSSKNVTLFAQARRGRNKAFFLLLELFVIYNEAANEDPPMALMWCFIGILLGLFIITMTFLILGLRRKPKHKNLFRLSQLESENGEIQSPTIHATSQFPESPDQERRHEAVDKLNSTRGAEGKDFPGAGNWSDLLGKDSSLYINPLWRGWRKEYLSLRGHGDEAELDTAGHEEEGLSRSEPRNLGGAAESDDIDHINSTGQGNNDCTSNRISSSCASCSEGDKGSDNNNNKNIQNSDTNNQQPDTTDISNANPEQSTCSTSNDPLRGSTNKRRSTAECDSLVASIPVGIPSHPVPDPQIFHTEQSYPKRTKRPEVSEDNVEQLKTRTSSTSTESPSNKLLSRFGLKNEDVCPTPSLCNTALSTPCLYDKDLREEFSRQALGKDLKSSPNVVTSSRLKVRSKPLRSRSLDSSCTSETAPLHNTYNALHLGKPYKPHNRTSPSPAATHSPTTQHQNEPLPSVKNKNGANLWPKVLVHDKPSAKHEEPNHLPVTKQRPKKSSTSRRASSGYYSNNSSPLVEYPGGITASENSGKSSEQRPESDSSLKRPQSLCSDDDLPPLPPPPPPLIPISPLPHMCLTGYQEPKTKNDNNSKNNSSRTAARKVHFKSSE